MFDSIFMFLEKLIPIPHPMIHDSLLLSSLSLFSSFTISAVTFIYLYVPGNYWTVIKIIFYNISCYIEAEVKFEESESESESELFCSS